MLAKRLAGSCKLFWNSSTNQAGRILSKPKNSNTRLLHDMLVWNSQKAMTKISRSFICEKNHTAEIVLVDERTPRQKRYQLNLQFINWIGNGGGSRMLILRAALTKPELQRSFLLKNVNPKMAKLQSILLYRIGDAIFLLYATLKPDIRRLAFAMLIMNIGQRETKAILKALFKHVVINGKQGPFYIGEQAEISFNANQNSTALHYHRKKWALSKQDTIKTIDGTNIYPI